MSACGMFLALITMILSTLRILAILANPAGIKYFMATCGRQNCDSVCASFGLQCAGTGQSFPNSSALSIFQSLGITCETSDYTDFYFYRDQPNYISSLPQMDVNLQWAGRCTGFKAIPSSIDCHTANNSNVRRLCPCHNSSAVLPPTQSTATETTNKITNITSRRIVTSAAQTRALQEHPTGNNAPRRQTENGDNAYKNALIAVSVILAVVLVMFFVVLLYLFVQRRRKHLSKEKRDAEKSDNGKCHVEYNKTGTGTSDMMDGLAVVTADDNSYCDPRSTELSIPNSSEMEVKMLADKPSNNKDMNEKSIDNILYVSGSDGEYTALSKEHTPPTYERLV
ncbi:uncharacterized protein [Porites lutea]|uniref:uncharacterized protein n=1 Tax=Porites lutea TaxID=51062 RepID=UPI003CC6A03D